VPDFPDMHEVDITLKRKEEGENLARRKEISFKQEAGVTNAARERGHLF